MSPHFTKSRKGSKRFDRAATSDIVVLSPPGMIKASQRDSSSCVRTSKKYHVVSSAGFFDFKMAAACRRSCRCSLKAPCSASTPTVMLFSSLILVIGFVFQHANSVITYFIVEGNLSITDQLPCLGRFVCPAAVISPQPSK